MKLGCRFGWHNWGRWRDARVHESAAQYCECEDCGKCRVRRIPVEDARK